MLEKIINRPVLAVIFFLIIILLGIFSFKNMTIGLVPNPEGGLSSMNIIYSWSGASPDMMLQKVLIPAESEIMKEVKGISKINSRATLNAGTLEVEFNRNIKMNFANLVLRERLNRLQNELPKSVRQPVISERIPENFEQSPLFRIGVYGKNFNIFTLKKLAEREIYPHLRAIPGIKEVNLSGGVEPEIEIRTNLKKLNRMNISVLEIQRKINEYFFTNHSLLLDKNSGEITLSLTESPKSIDELRNIYIKKYEKENI